MNRDGRIHVWRMNLAGACMPDAERVLTSADLERADRFAFPRDRNRFLRTRYGLRRILASYLDLDPAELPILLTPLGKPTLEPGYRLGFNLSHSGDCALLAVGESAEIGIDIQTTIPAPDVRRLARSVFSADEALALGCAPEDASPEAFLTCWTRKEAYLKAIGVGLTIDLMSVTVGTEPGRRRIEIEGRPAGDFADVVTFIQDDSYVASLAVVGGYASVVMREYAYLAGSAASTLDASTTPPLRRHHDPKVPPPGESGPGETIARAAGSTACAGPPPTEA